MNDLYILVSLGISFYLWLHVARRFGGNIGLGIALFFWVGVPYIVLTGKKYQKDDHSDHEEELSLTPVKVPNNEKESEIAKTN